MHADRDDQRLELNDDTLLSCLRRTLAQERQVTAEVLRLMAEVDRRRLYAQFACESMFAFSTGVLGMSEAAAYKRYPGRARRTTLPHAVGADRCGTAAPEWSVCARTALDGRQSRRVARRGSGIGQTTDRAAGRRALSQARCRHQRAQAANGAALGHPQRSV